MGNMLAATAMFAFGPIFIRMGLNEGIRAEHLIVLRTLVALPCFVLAIIVLRQFRQAALSLRDIVFISVVSVGGMGAAMYCFINSINILGASLSTLLGICTPAFTVVLAWLLGRSSITRMKLGSFALSSAGLALLVIPAAGVGAMGAALGGSLAGVLYSLGASFCSACAMLAYEKYIQSKSSLVAAFHVTAFMFLYFGAVYGLPDRALSPRAWVIVLLLGIFSWFIPFMLFFRGLRSIGASRTALVQNAGPLVTITAASFLLNERLAPLQFAGMALMMGAVYLLGREKEGLPAPVRPE